MEKEKVLFEANRFLCTEACWTERYFRGEGVAVLRMYWQTSIYVVIIFREGEEVVRAVTSVGVYGMFCKGVQFLFYYFAEFKAYESAAQSLYSKFLLGYVTGETATSL